MITHARIVSQHVVDIQYDCRAYAEVKGVKAGGQETTVGIIVSSAAEKVHDLPSFTSLMSHF